MISVTVEPSEIRLGHEAELMVCIANPQPKPCTNLVLVLDLPRDLLLVRGGTRINIRVIDGHSSVTIPLSVKARRPGQLAIESRNFSYRGADGRAQRIPYLSLPLQVREEEPATTAEPALIFDALTGDLVAGECCLLRGRVTNEGSGSAQQLRIAAHGSLGGALQSDSHAIASLEPGETQPFELSVHTPAKGQVVPVDVVARYLDPRGEARSTQQSFRLGVAGRKGAATIHIEKVEKMVGTEVGDIGFVRGTVGGISVGGIEAADSITGTQVGDIGIVRGHGKAAAGRRFCPQCGIEFPQDVPCRYCPSCGAATGINKERST